MNIRQAVRWRGPLDGKLRLEPDGEKQLTELLQLFLSHEVATVRTPKELAQRMAAIARLVRSLIEKTFEGEEKTGSLHGFPGSVQDDADSRPRARPVRGYVFANDRLRIVRGAHQRTGGEAITRKDAVWSLPKTNPFLRDLFNQIAGATLDDRIAWAVDDIANLLTRSDMAAILEDFGKRDAKSDPVVHFCETFLAAYDPRLRESRGVYYTPEPVVSLHRPLHRPHFEGEVRPAHGSGGYEHAHPRPGRGHRHLPLFCHPAYPVMPNRGGPGRRLE